jgi:hypothetical protein
LRGAGKDRPIAGAPERAAVGVYFTGTGPRRVGMRKTWRRAALADALSKAAREADELTGDARTH